MSAIRLTSNIPRCAPNYARCQSRHGGAAKRNHAPLFESADVKRVQGRLSPLGHAVHAHRLKFRQVEAEVLRHE
jgi:hypothetical protein